MIENAEEPEEAYGPGLPVLPRRLLDVFINPGRLTETLSKKPAWWAVSLLMVALIAISWSLIPVELIEATQRQALLGMGRDVPSSTLRW